MNPSSPAARAWADKLIMLRMLTAGESHGPRPTLIVEDLPAGIALTIGTAIENVALRRPRPRHANFVYERYRGRLAAF